LLTSILHVTLLSPALFVAIKVYVVAVDGLMTTEPKALTCPISGSIRIRSAFETCQLKMEVCPGIIRARVVPKL